MNFYLFSHKNVRKFQHGAKCGEYHKLYKIILKWLKIALKGLVYGGASLEVATPPVTKYRHYY